MFFAACRARSIDESTAPSARCRRASSICASAARGFTRSVSVNALLASSVRCCSSASLPLREKGARRTWIRLNGGIDELGCFIELFAANEDAAPS